MTDLEMTRLCAEAMDFCRTAEFGCECGRSDTEPCPLPSAPVPYDPLHDDAQAMALVKKFDLRIDHNDSAAWSVCKDHGLVRPPEQGWSEDLNRAIVECVAKMQAAKK